MASLSNILCRHSIGGFRLHRKKVEGGGGGGGVNEKGGAIGLYYFFLQDIGWGRKGRPLRPDLLVAH